MPKALKNKPKIKEDVIWDKVLLSRHPKRIYSNNIIEEISCNFKYLRGDKQFSDDSAIISGVAKLKNSNRRYVFICHQKGRNTQERIERNFGMAHPEGYRKAMRFFSLAEKFNLPVLCLVDTPGAFPGIEAERRGQSTAIAQSIQKMTNLKVPIVTIIIGEGGSGGALAMATSDKVIMLENSIYSVISPESCASILWRDSKKNVQSAKALKLNASNVKKLGVVDDIIKETSEQNDVDRKKLCGKINIKVEKYFSELHRIKPETLIKNRYKKFRNIGSKFLNEKNT